MVTSLSLLHGIRPSDFGISRLVKLSDNSTDTRRKYSPYAFPQIIDKLFPQVLIRKLSSGTLWLIANTLQTIPTIKTGSLKSDILPNWRLRPNLPSNPILHLLDGMEDLKSGTLTSKLETLSNPTMDSLTQLPFPQMPNTWPLEVKTKSSISGMWLI